MSDEQPVPRPQSTPEFRRMLIRAVDYANRADVDEPLLDVPPLERARDLGSPDVQAPESPGKTRDEGER